MFDTQDDRIIFKSVDLLGPKDRITAALRDAGGEEADHVFFYAYVAKADEGELIETNRILFENVSGCL